jgi:hypothetical protein
MLPAVRALAIAVLVACRPPAPEVPLPPLAPGAIRLEHNPCGDPALLVAAELDGSTGWFVLDSGSYTNVVFEDFAQGASLAHVNAGERVGGGLGVPVDAVQLHSFAVRGLPELTTGNFVMLGREASPLARQTCGEAGVLVPALLATPDAAVVIDYGTAQLQRVAQLDVDARLDAIAGRRFTASRAANEYTPGIDVGFGAGQLRMMIDTGACCSWVTTTSAVGRASLARSRTHGDVERLLGTTTSRVASADVRFGDVRRTLDLRLLVPDDNDAMDSGGLGADALRGCVVAVTPTEIRGSCRDPN